jgi:metal-sulfur cluster biosynthetic enzyme
MYYALIKHTYLTRLSSYQVIADDAKTRIASLSGVEEATVEIVWEPVWNPKMISEEGKKVLGLE